MPYYKSMRRIAVWTLVIGFSLSAVPAARWSGAVNTLAIPAEDLHALGALDFNGDGRRDILVGSLSGAFVFCQREEGTFPDKPDASLLVQKCRTGVAVGDLDADGRPDIAVAEHNNGFHMFLSRDGFQRPRFFRCHDSWKRLGMAIGDFNGDGCPDLVTTGRLMFGRNDGSFDKGYAYPPPGRNWLAPPVFADFDGDGTADLLYATPRLELYRCPVNVRRLHFRDFGEWVCPDLDYPIDTVAAADLNDDGRADIIATNSYDPSRRRTRSIMQGCVVLRKVFVFIQGSPCGFSGMPTHVLEGMAGPLAVGDFDGDGKATLAVGLDYGRVALFDFIAGQKPLPRFVRTPGAYGYTDLLAADLNDDGADELLVACIYGKPGVHILSSEALTRAEQEVPK